MHKIYLQVIKNVNVLWCIYVSVSTLKMKFVYTKLLLFTRGSNFYYCWLIIYGVTCCMFVGFCESVSIDLVESFSFDAIRPRNMVALVRMKFSLLFCKFIMQPMNRSWIFEMVHNMKEILQSISHSNTIDMNCLTIEVMLSDGLRGIWIRKPSQHGVKYINYISINYIYFYWC